MNVDGGWWAGSDTGTVVRNASGFVQVNPLKYPDGIQVVVDHIHSKGLRYGHYTDAGKRACNGDAPMSEGFEQQDVALFASWGVDMLKVDACSVAEPSHVVMERWSQLLNKTGRPVLLSNCRNGCLQGPAKDTWAPWCETVTNMARSSSDIRATWTSMLANLDSVAGAGDHGMPGHFNDPDFLELFNGEFAMDGSAAAVNMNRAHFSLWAIVSAPLILGNDLRNMSKEEIDLVTNTHVININQQYAGSAGGRIKSDGGGTAQVWAKPLPSGTAAVALFNARSPASLHINVTFAEVPGLPAGVSTCAVYHVWDDRHGTATGSVGAMVSPHSVELLLLQQCS